MARQDSPVRSNQDSLIAASRRLDRANTDPVNYGVLAEAVREGLMAVEYHLDSLRARHGTEEQVVGTEPRLIPEVRRLDAALSGLLTELWSAQRDLPRLADDLRARLTAIASGMRDADARETALLHEVQVSIGGLD